MQRKSFWSGACQAASPTALIVLAAFAQFYLAAYAGDDGVKDGALRRVFIAAKKFPILYPPAPEPRRDQLVPPPGENRYFPVRPDSQPFVLNVDSTVNLTAALNEFYFNPKWCGEDWAPFDQVEAIERACRLMSTWREYNEANVYNSLTPVNKFFERVSGFGPP